MKRLLFLAGALALLGCAPPRVYEFDWSPDNPPEDRAAFMLAVEHWNERGIVYLQLAPGGVPVSYVDVAGPLPGYDADGMALDCNAGGLTGHVDSGTHILYHHTGDGNVRALLEHELGHVLGLPHYGDGLMYPGTLRLGVQAGPEEDRWLLKIHGAP